MQINCNLKFTEVKKVSPTGTYNCSLKITGITRYIEKKVSL